MIKTQPYVSPWSTPEIEAMRGEVRGFVTAEVVPHQARWKKQHCVDRDVWTKAGALGLLCADIPETYGGTGGTFAHQAVFFEELMYGNDTAMNVAVHAIAAHYILNQGTEAQKQLFLPRLATGE